MELRILSDLHLEFADFKVPHIPGDESRVLILAGDIGIVNKPTQLTEYVAFIRSCCAQFQDVVLIFGNHEYYHGSIVSTERKFLAGFIGGLPTNLHLLDNSSWEKDNVIFLGATLWTSGDRENPLISFHWDRMSDSHLIRTGTTSDPYSHRYNFHNMCLEHGYSWNWLRQETKKAKDLGKYVVWVNHHAISNKSVHENYAGDSFNFFYVSPELEEEVIELSPDLVIHGHTHTSFNYILGEGLTPRVICNPRGYYPNEPNPDFFPEMIVEVPKSQREYFEEYLVELELIPPFAITPEGIYTVPWLNEKWESYKEDYRVRLA